MPMSIYGVKMITLLVGKKQLLPKSVQNQSFNVHENHGHVVFAYTFIYNGYR